MNKVFYLRNNAIKNYLIEMFSKLEASELNPLQIVIREPKRSLDQNAALWPLLQKFAEQKTWPVNGKMVEMAPEDWKDLLTAAFRNEANRVAVGINGGIVFLGMRTSKMGKKEFSDFLEFVHATAIDLGVDLTDERMAA